MSFADTLAYADYYDDGELSEIAPAPVTELDAEIAVATLKHDVNRPTVCLLKGTDDVLDSGVFAVKQCLYQFALSAPDELKGRWITEAMVASIIATSLLPEIGSPAKRSKPVVDQGTQTAMRLRTLIETHMFEVAGLSENFPSLLVCKMSRDQLAQKILRAQLSEMPECDDSASSKLRRIQMLPEYDQYCFMFSGYTFVRGDVDTASTSFTVALSATGLVHDYTMRRIDMSLIADATEAANVSLFLTCLVVYGQLSSGKLYDLSKLYERVSAATKIKTVAFESIVSTVINKFTVFSGQRTCNSCAPTWSDGVYFTANGSHICVTQADMYGLFPELRFAATASESTEVSSLRQELGPVVFPTIDGSKSYLIAAAHDMNLMPQVAAAPNASGSQKQAATKKRKR